MDFSVVLAHLQNQFSGQLVLYVHDIAKVLGKSDKAIANLIARNSLPFKVKTVGGFRCVDIFQVAQWLASDPDVAGESLAAAPKSINSGNRSGKSVKVVKALRMQKRPDLVGQPEVPAELSELGPMAAKILSMRHDAPFALSRFAARLRNHEDAAFIQDVVETLFYSVGLMPSSYVVTLKKYAPRGFRVLGEESRRYFESEDRACSYLVGRLSSARYSKTRQVVHFVLECSSSTLFHAVVVDRNFSVLNNDIKLELPSH